MFTIELTILLRSPAFTFIVRHISKTQLPCCCHDSSVEIHCGSLETPSNGSKIGNNDVVDSVMMFSCDYGFRLSGSAQRNCTDVGEWNGMEAMCIGTSMHPSIYYSSLRFLYVKLCISDNFFIVQNYVFFLLS